MVVDFRALILGTDPPHPKHMLNGGDLADMDGPVAAVYVLWREGEAQYVGHSGNLSSRILAHRKDKTFDHFTFYPVSKAADRLRLEGVMILALRPRLNKGLYLGVGPDRVWELPYSFTGGPARSRSERVPTTPKAKKKARKKKAK